MAQNPFAAAAGAAAIQVKTRLENQLVAGAGAWSVLVLLLAFWMPLITVMSDHAGQQPRWTLVHYFGYKALFVVAIPIVVTALVAVLLRPRSESRGRWLVACCLSGALLLATGVGFVTILAPVIVMPVPVLLTGACVSRKAHLQLAQRTPLTS
jgi:hypothetical protein